MDLLMTRKEMKQMLDVAAGRAPGDLLIQNVRLVDVYCEKIYPADILIYNGRVAAVNPDFKPQVKQTFDGGWLYALPGFVDPHFHVDSTQGTPASLSGAIVPRGTTTLCGEFLDITHFAGIYGKDPVETCIAYAKDYDKLPYRLLPLAPGKMSPARVTKELLGWEGSFGLGEMLSHNLLCQVEEYLEIIEQCRREKRFISGHLLHIVWDFPDNDVTRRPLGFRQMTDDEINQLALLGYPHDHEIFNYEGVERILRRGMNPLVRTFEGLVDKVMPGVINDHLPLDHIGFCMDDIFLQDIRTNGFMDKAVEKCVAMGMDPIRAVRIATLNNAINIGLEREVGSLTPGRFADVVLVPSMREISPKYVFKGGELVAQAGKLLHEPRVDYSSLKWAFKSLLQDMDAGELEYPAQDVAGDGVTTKAAVYNVRTRTFETYELPVVGGLVQPDPANDIIRGAVVDRTDAHKVIHLFFKGFGLKEGAMAINFCQNVYRIVVAGLETGPMLEAVKEIDRHLGGMTAVDEDGKVFETLVTEIAACASDLPCDELVAQSTRILEQVGAWGVDLENPFMILWFTGFLYLWD